MYSVKEISKIVSGTLVGVAEGKKISDFSTDSRKILKAQQTLFIALKGLRHDGHEYLQQVYDQGVRSFLVSELPEILLKDAAYILTKDTISAFQKLATYHLSKLPTEVIAITGSNGKTIVKEWLYQIISPHFTAVRNPKSYNSQIGVPMSVMHAAKQHQYGIFEAGISQKGEMKKLASILKPKFGIFTNLGDAHSAGFPSLKIKAEEKLRLFEKSALLVYCKDHAALDKIIQNWEKETGVKTATWSFKSAADLSIFQVEESRNGKRLSALYNQVVVSIDLPFKDPVSIENAVHCWLLALSLNIKNEKIRDGFSALSTIDMRLLQTEGIHQTQLIHDYYNSDLTSLEIAIDFLSRQQTKPKRSVIISDVEQNDLPPAKLYRKVAKILSDKGIDRVVGIGKDIHKMHFVFKMKEKTFYEDMDAFLKDFKTQDWQNESILIKGARSYKFEQIGRLLQNRQHETRFEINLTKMEQNLNYFRSKLKKSTQIMAMVKAYSYGSGTHEVAKMLQYNRVHYLAVAYPDEGILLRNSGITLPIMVLNAQAENFQVMDEHQLEAVIYSFEQLQQLTNAIRHMQISSAKIHLEFDTGMHRLGFNLDEIKKITAHLHLFPEIKVISVFSHLAASESEKMNAFTSEQISKFDTCCQQIEKHIGYSFIKHLANTGGILYHPEAAYDMVRLGIGLYGVDPGNSSDSPLQPVGRLISFISQIRDVAEGEGIGYGNLAKSNHSRKIAVVAIGYADGVSRKLSNGKGYFRVNGERAPIVGNICMDMTMIDVTNIACKAGDEVLIFGEDPSIESIATKIETIPYEILTSVSERVKRVFVQE